MKDDKENSKLYTKLKLILDFFHKSYESKGPNYLFQRAM
jgi:hypothetical protein